MVPLADVFNHKSAIVALQGDFELVPACLMGGADDSDAPDDSAAEEKSSSECTKASKHSNFKIALTAWKIPD